MVKHLTAHGASLRLDADPSGWCQVILQIGEQEIELGADKLKIVEERLAAGLAERLSRPNAGSIDGKPVQWVMSLAERHSTIYASDEGRTRRLYFNNASGTNFYTLDLSEEERRAWQDELGRSGPG